MRILLIDDVGSNLAEIRGLLKESGIGAYTLSTTDAASGLSQLASGPFDLCLSAASALTEELLALAFRRNVPLLAVISDGQESAATGLDIQEREVHVLDRNCLTGRNLGFTIRSALRHARMRREAQEMKTLFQLTQESAGVGTWQWDVGTQKVTWSRNLFRLFGLEPGIDESDMFQTWLDAIHPDDRSDALSAATAAMADLAPLSSFFRILRRDPAQPDGAPEIRWIHNKGEVIRDPDGRIVRLIGINIDITQEQTMREVLRDSEKAAAHELFDSEARFRTYFESSPDCMFHVDVDLNGRFTYADVNPAGLAAAGLRLDQMVGRTPEELLGPEKGREMTAGLRAVCRANRPFRYEPTWMMAQGESAYDALYLPLRDERGAITGILGVARDVTEQRALEASMRQSQKMEAIGQLASGVAHDFNNVLMVFQACLRLLDKEIPTEKGRLLLAEGISAVDRGHALTKWLVSFVRQSPVSLSAIDLNAAMVDIGGMVQRTLKHDVRFHQELSSDVDPVIGDVNELALAVLNLAINARDAMPNGGELRITTRSETVSQRLPDGIEVGEYGVVEVADTGSGMSPEVLARALEPFFTTKEPGRGTGLGLSMVYGIVRRSEGGVRISSVEGQGTRVSLYFLSAQSHADREDQRLRSAVTADARP